MMISAFGPGLILILISISILCCTQIETRRTIQICNQLLDHFRHEKRVWFITLLLGTCMLYSTRTSMPLLTPAVSTELRWSKTESGTVLSSFFWGYTVTQVNNNFITLISCL